MRISDWSSDVCSSDLHSTFAHGYFAFPKLEGPIANRMLFRGEEHIVWSLNNYLGLANHPEVRKADELGASEHGLAYPMGARMMSGNTSNHESRSEEHTSELQSLMRISYAVFCLKKKKTTNKDNQRDTNTCIFRHNTEE